MFIRRMEHGHDIYLYIKQLLHSRPTHTFIRIQDTYLYEYKYHNTCDTNLSISSMLKLISKIFSLIRNLTIYCDRILPGTHVPS